MTKSSNIKSYNRKTLKALVLALAGFGMVSQPIDALANPQGGQVVAGSATITQETATKLGITQTTNKAIINWRSFSIGNSEHTQFYQPSANSVNLSRVVGGDPSQILGRLTANGQVFLVNPNGILFGKNAQVDVAGLVASTHNIRNEDFLAGRYNFSILGNPGASVINEGTIRVADTGIAAFVAPSVANRGVLVAKLGKVALAAANGFTLDFTGDQLLTFLVSDEVAKTAFDLEGKQLTSFVENSGRIEAQGGYVLLTAKAAENAIHSVINQTGTIEATSAERQNGEIILAGGLHGVVSNTGTLNASGKSTDETGGTVQITGEKIGLFAGTRIDVSGDQGGGKAIIGGDYLGGRASDALMDELDLQREAQVVPTAQFTYMDASAVIHADALNNGDGGKVVVWADNTTRAYGSITASGGATSGDGGFVEVSGKNGLEITGLDVSANAPNGKGGTVLFDPGSIRIVAAATNVTYTGGMFTASVDPTQIDRDQIETMLTNGTNVTIRTQTESDFWSGPIELGHIDVEADIIKTGRTEATLKLFAGNVIRLHQNVTIAQDSGLWDSLGTLNVYLDSDYDRLGYGLVDLQAGSKIATNGGWLIMNGHEILTFGEINRNRGSVDDIDDGYYQRIHVYYELKGSSLSAILGPEPVTYITPSDVAKSSGPIILAESAKELAVFKAADERRPSVLKIEKSFNPSTALEAGLLAAVAYQETNFVNQWLSDRGYDLVGKALHDSAGNDAYLAKTTAGGKTNFIITIRGTEPGADGDIGRDLDAESRQSKYLSSDVKAHRGFVQLAESVFEMVYNNETFVKEFLRGNATLTIAGHSLGGAASILLTAMLQEQFKSLGVKNRMQTYTFGAPSPLDAPTTNPYSNLNVHRVEVQGDKVPLLQGARQTLGGEAIRLTNSTDGAMAAHSMTTSYLKQLMDQKL